uniref:Uncharacterized protein n=1 Tax=Panagrolaimus superbus TaxID=310955 RepID=A0A914Z038_9BILA
MEITIKCNKSFQKENLSKDHKQELAEMFDKFLKQTIYPLSKALDVFLPVIKDAAVMARDSARACTLFSQWSREFGDSILKDGLTWEIMIYKAEELQNRFRENGIPKFWLCPSIIPLFKTIVEQFKRQIPRNRSLTTDTSRSDPASIGILDQQLRDDATVLILKNEIQQKNLELKKEKTKVGELRNLVDQLHTEKEELITELSAVEDTKLNLDKSLIRARRSANSMDSPSIPIIIPKIQLQESQDADQEHDRGNTPEELQDLIERHEEEASPPSEVSEENTIDEFEKMEEEAAATLTEKNASDEEVSGDADDEISLTTPRIDDGEKKHGIEEELVDGESVAEEVFNDGINSDPEHHFKAVESDGEIKSPPVILNHDSEVQNTEEIEGQEAITNDIERSQSETPKFEISSENEIIENVESEKNRDEEDKVFEEENQSDAVNVKDISRSEINTPPNEKEKSQAETPTSEINTDNKVGDDEMLEDHREEDTHVENTNENDVEENENITKAEENISENQQNNNVNEQDKTIIEFWHLAKVLANLLQLKIPEEEEILDEHERRKTTLDKILEEMQKLLIHLRNDDTSK